MLAQSSKRFVHLSKFFQTDKLTDSTLYRVLHKCNQICCPFMRSKIFLSPILATFDTVSKYSSQGPLVHIFTGKYHKEQR